MACNHEKNKPSANFCKSCGRKLKADCDCWVLNKKHNCGEEKCPGLKLLLKPH